MILKMQLKLIFGLSSASNSISIILLQVKHCFAVLPSNLISVSAILSFASNEAPLVYFVFC